MEKIFIRKLTIEKVRNLKPMTIPLSDQKIKHLIFTGKNGSGKTTLLNCLAESLDSMNQNCLYRYDNQKDMDIIWTDDMSVQPDEDKHRFTIEMNCPLVDFGSAFESGEFVLAYYKADRIFNTDIPRHVEKVELQRKYNIYDTPRQDFVKYLLDMKVTQALAVSGGKKEKALKIQQWLDSFEQLLQRIFEDNKLKLLFDEDSFLFSILQPGKEAFDFNTLSSGYAAVLDIVVDIMLRMERRINKTFIYDLAGIVLIDEIETHLHLELQKKVLDLLTTIFPNIQFIVTTHSPFVLNNLENVVIYDLEQNILVENGLANIPYDGIVEGYFHADVLSEKLKEKFDKYKSLVKKENLEDADFEQLTNLEIYLDEIPDYLGLGITTEYQRLKLEFSQRTDIDD